MSKKYKTLVLAVCSIVAVAAFASLLVKDSRKPASASNMCAKTGPIRRLAVRDNAFSPSTVTVHRCDRIQVTNYDNVPREIALGEHSHHTQYPGFEEKALGGGDSLTFTATTTGHYLVHDHFHDNVQAEITIN